MKYNKDLIFIEGEIARYQENSSDLGSGDTNSTFDGCEKICGGKNAAVKDFINKGRELYEFVNALPSEFQTTKLDKIKKVCFVLVLCFVYYSCNFRRQPY